MRVEGKLISRSSRYYFATRITCLGSFLDFGAIRDGISRQFGNVLIESIKHRTLACVVGGVFSRVFRSCFVNKEAKRENDGGGDERAPAFNPGFNPHR